MNDKDFLVPLEGGYVYLQGPSNCPHRASRHSIGQIILFAREADEDVKQAGGFEGEVALSAVLSDGKILRFVMHTETARALRDTLNTAITVAEGRSGK